MLQLPCSVSDVGYQAWDFGTPQLTDMMLGVEVEVPKSPNPLISDSEPGALGSSRASESCGCGIGEAGRLPAAETACHQKPSTLNPKSPILNPKP